MWKVKYLLIYLCIISLISVAATAFDKCFAIYNKRRISEKTLLLLAAAGGGAFMYITMRIIRHKTRKNKFMAGIPIIVLIQTGLLIMLHFNFFAKF